MRCDVLSFEPVYRRQSSHNGFTLIEMLIAISILAVVAVLGWRGLDSIVRARTALADNLEQTRSLQLAFAQLQNDCINAATSGVLQSRIPMQTAGHTLVLVRNVIADTQPTRVQVVRYRLRNNQLTRWESPAVRDLGELDRWLQMANTDATTSQEVTLQSGVAAMQLRPWNNGWLDGDAAIAPDNVVNTTGLEVSLQLQNRSNGMRKVYLLGAA